MSFKSQLDKMSNSKISKRTIHTFVFAESAGISPFFRCQSDGAFALCLARRLICRAFLVTRGKLGPGPNDGERGRFDPVLTKVGVAGRGVRERSRSISISGLGAFELGAFELGAFELGAFELGAFELGAFELEAFELGALKPGTSKSGT